MYHNLVFLAPVIYRFLSINGVIRFSDKCNPKEKIQTNYATLYFLSQHISEKGNYIIYSKESTDKRIVKILIDFDTLNGNIENNKAHIGHNFIKKQMSIL